MDSFCEQGEADEEVVVSIGGVNVEIEGFWGGQAAASAAQLLPAFVVDGCGGLLRRVELEATTCKQREKLVGQPRFRRARKGEWHDTFRAEFREQERCQTRAESGSIDDQRPDTPVFDERDHGGILLKMSATCPPLVMNNVDAWQIQLIKEDSPDGDNGTVALAAGEVAAGCQPRRWSLFSGHVHTCDIPAIRGGSLFPGVRTLQEHVMQVIQQLARAADGAQQVLGLDGGMVLAQARNFVFDEGAVLRVNGGDYIG